MIERNVLEWRLDPHGVAPQHGDRSRPSHRRLLPGGLLVGAGGRVARRRRPRRRSRSHRRLRRVGRMPDFRSRRRTRRHDRTETQSYCTGSCPPRATAAPSSRSGPTATTARRPSTTSARSPGPPTTSASPACSPPRARGARTRGSSRQRSSARRSGSSSSWRSVPNSISPDARRAEGRDVPADLRRAAAVEHRDRRRRQRAAALRRLARPRRALRPHRRVPVGAARRAERAAVRLRGPLLPRGRCDGQPEARADPRAVLRRRVRRCRGRGRQARRRLPRLGRAAVDDRTTDRSHARTRR